MGDTQVPPGAAPQQSHLPDDADASLEERDRTLRSQDHSQDVTRHDGHHLDRGYQRRL